MESKQKTPSNELQDDDFDYDMELDTHWIQEHEKENNIDKNILREPQPIIPIYFVYINKNNYIEQILMEKRDLFTTENNTHILSKERVLHIIQSNRHFHHKKYRFIDLFSYNIDLEPENIQSFIQGNNSNPISKEFLKVLPFFNDIIITDSIFIFHSMNGIYFMFKENEKQVFKKKLKPILKKADKTKKCLEGSLTTHNITKKVLFQEDMTTSDNLEPTEIQHNKTKKRISIKPADHFDDNSSPRLDG